MNGREAMAAAEQKAFDAILMDVQMPSWMASRRADRS